MSGSRRRARGGAVVGRARASTSRTRRFEPPLQFAQHRAIRLVRALRRGPAARRLARAIDSSKRSISISRAYSVSAVQRDISAARRVTSGVTDGLPSRSPPIHEPKRIGAASSGRPRPVTIRRSVRSSDRQNSRHARSRSSPRTPPCPSGLRRAATAVRAGPPRCARRRRSRGASSRAAPRARVGVRSGRSSSASASAMRLYLCCSVRRMISVGCAVITSSMRRPQIASSSASGDTPAAEQPRQRLLDRRLLRTAARLALVARGAAAPGGAVRRCWRG